MRKRVKSHQWFPVLFLLKHFCKLPLSASLVRGWSYTTFGWMHFSALFWRSFWWAYSRIPTSQRHWNLYKDKADRCIKVFWQKKQIYFLKMVEKCSKFSLVQNLTINDQPMSDWGNKRLNKDASCLLWWCGRDGIFGYCNMFPTRVTDDYNSTKCKIQDAEHRIDHLLIAYLKQLNRRLNGEVELGCQPGKNELSNFRKFYN